MLDAIEKSGRDSSELNRRMGVGISHLNDLLDGIELDLWAASYVDSALMPEKPSGPWHSA